MSIFKPNDTGNSRRIKTKIHNFDTMKGHKIII